MEQRREILRRSNIKIGLLLSGIPATTLTLWAILVTLQNYPAHGTPVWFIEGVFSLSLLFTLVSGWHGLGSSIAVGASTPYLTNVRSSLRLIVLALSAACGSLVASLLADLLLVLIFPASVKGLGNIALGASSVYAVFFGASFAYVHGRTNRKAKRKSG